MGVNAAYNGL